MGDGEVHPSGGAGDLGDVGPPILGIFGPDDIAHIGVGFGLVALETDFLQG